jgi:pimeloyl-ACP methyl ester carboxylesterase
MQIKVLNKNINYEILNSDWLEDCRPLLIFLHEGLGSIGQWKDFPQLLSDEMKLPALVYDRVGYGGSDDWGGKINPDFLHREAVEYLPALLEVLDLPNEHYVIGHSDGGTIALRYAAEQPSQLRAIIVEAPHVFLEDQSLQGIRTARLMLRKPEIIERMNRYQNGRAAQLIEAWSGLWLRDDVRDWEMLEYLPKIDCPMLLVQGENDDFGTFKQLDITADLAQSKFIQVEKLEDCGHVPHLQQQDIVMNLCRAFLKKF